MNQSGHVMLLDKEIESIVHITIEFLKRNNIL